MESIVTADVAARGKKWDEKKYLSRFMIAFGSLLYLDLICQEMFRYKTTSQL